MAWELFEVTAHFKKGGGHVIMRQGRQQGGGDRFIGAISKGEMDVTAKMPPCPASVSEEPHAEHHKARPRAYDQNTPPWG
jgi:hypothetical protein